MPLLLRLPVTMTSMIKSIERNASSHVMISYAGARSLLLFAT
jgi:hypothetical protein